MAKINGQTDKSADGETLLHFLERSGYNISRIAVELNDEIISKSKYADTTISTDDIIEIVSFVGGG